MPPVLSDHWLLALAIALLVLAVAFHAHRDGPVAGRVFGRFIFVIALPLAVFFGVIFLGVALLFDPNERIWQAIIAGSVIAAGWLTTAIFNELGKGQSKEERLRDYHKALFAEIRNSLSVMWDEGRAAEDAGKIVESMEADPDFVPFIPHEQHDHIYDAILDEIEVLPRVTIDAIVAYYGLAKSMSALAEDMRGEGFQKMDQKRRIQMYGDYFETRKRAFAAGEFALGLIREFSESGNEAAKRFARASSNPVLDRNGPEAGSE